MADFTAADDEIEHRQNTMTPAAFFPSARKPSGCLVGHALSERIAG
jgi:hypothetical protein